MIVLDNEQLAELVSPADALQALRTAYRDLMAGDAAMVPRIDLYAPAAGDGEIYRWGSMSGICRSLGVAAVRIKSDVVRWQDGVEQKHCVREGQYCGIILLYSIADGAPLALLQDGYLQHLRVGAAVAIAADLLARPDAGRVAVLGSGGMARACLEALALVRPPTSVTVFSPKPDHRRQFANDAERMAGVRAEPVATAEQAVRGAELVVSATSSLGATLDPDWLAPGSHVSFVSRREVPSQLQQRVAVGCRLGMESVPADLEIPGMAWFRGGYAGYATGSQQQRARIPGMRGTEAWPTLALADLLASGARPGAQERSAVVAVGTQGLQFAAVAGTAYRNAVARRRGIGIPDEWFLQDIRD